MLLELLALPSPSIRSIVKTSPLACGSICTRRLLGWPPPVKVDRAALMFHIPNVESAAETVAIATSRTVRMTAPRCVPCAVKARKGVSERGFIHLHPTENTRYHRTHA